VAKLFDVFCAAPDELVEGNPWKIYNTMEKNKLITDNYGQLPSEVMRTLDDAEVISIKHCNGHTKTYVRYERSVYK
jgi:hypothetical protein